MWYHQFKYKNNLIEFKNGTWDGVEHIIVNGDTVSSKYSVMGTSHQFRVGPEICTMIVKVNPLNMVDVYLSFFAGNRMIFRNVLVKKTLEKSVFSLSFYGHRRRGEKHLKLYDISEAIEEFKQAIEAFPKDAESHYYLACCYSLEEDVNKGIHHLKEYLSLKKDGMERILAEDRLAFLRVQEQFDQIKK